MVPSFFGFHGKYDWCTTEHCPPMEKPYGEGICTLFMKIKKPGMNIWLNQECAIPRIFVIIVIECLWNIINGKGSLFKWIFPLLSGDHRFDNAF